MHPPRAGWVATRRIGDQNGILHHGRAERVRDLRHPRRIQRRPESRARPVGREQDRREILGKPAHLKKVDDQ